MVMNGRRTRVSGCFWVMFFDLGGYMGVSTL